MAALDDGASVRVEMVRQVLDAEHEERRRRQLPGTIERGGIDDLDVAQPLDVELDAGPVGLDQDEQPGDAGPAMAEQAAAAPELGEAAPDAAAAGAELHLDDALGLAVATDDGVELLEVADVGALARGQQVGVDDALLQERQACGQPGSDGGLDERAGAVQVTGILAWPEPAVGGCLSAHLLDVGRVVDAHELDASDLGGLARQRCRRGARTRSSRTVGRR